MVLHVKDDETDMLVRRLAQKRGVGITTAIKEAVTEALGRKGGGNSLWDDTADIRAMISSHKQTGLKADKAFFDDLSGQGDGGDDGGIDNVR